MITIVITGHKVIVATFVVVMTVVAYFAKKKIKARGLLSTIMVISIVLATVLFSSITGGIIANMDAHDLAEANKIAKFNAMVESIPEAWNPIVTILGSRELRAPARMKLVRDRVQDKILPELTISQQNYLIESTFKCSVCGCSVNCNRLRDQLSELLAVHVNPFARQK